MQTEFTFKRNKTERLDTFLAQKLKTYSRQLIQKEIRLGNIKVNQKNVLPSYLLKLSDKIIVNLQQPTISFQLKPWKEFPLEVIFHNQDWAIIEKPANIAVHPFFPFSEKTLIESLIHHFPQIKKVGDNPSLRPGIVHRLDKETSGLLLVALNQPTFLKLKKLFQKRKIEKKYLAIVWGKPQRKESTISSFIGYSRFKKTKRATSYQPQKLINPKKAITFFKLIKTKKDKSLLEVIPKTGRTHQIRLHLHSIGLPVVGDKKYSLLKFQKKNQNYSRHLLHASQISFYFNHQKFNFFSSKNQIFNQYLTKNNL